MKGRLFLGGGVLFAGALLTGCAATGGSDTVAAACGSDYHCTRDLMFQYRQQATDLSIMAERYAREADIKARELGQDSAEVKKNQEIAKKLWAEAQEADQRARDYQYQLPHNAH
jgi:hypothetical protein